MILEGKDSIHNVVCSCLKDDIEYYLNPRWFDLFPSAYLLDESDGLRFCMTDLDISVCVRLGEVVTQQEDVVLDGEVPKFKFLHMKDSEVYLEYYERNSTEEIKIPLHDKKVKSLVVKYARQQFKLYYNKVIAVRGFDPSYRLYDGDELIGFRD